jgi:hypothetical protein
MFTRLYELGARALFRILLRPEPPLPLDAAKLAAFDSLALSILAGGNQPISYALPYPKHEFTRYLIRRHPVLLHGTPHLDVTELAPRAQIDHSGARRNSVFATDDGVWPFFFATLHRDRFAGPISLRNAAMVVGEGASQRRYYLFSVNRELRDARPFRAGAIYVLPRETFQRTDTRTVHFPEWASDVPVRPLARIDVKPDDFPFHNRIAAHRRGELFPFTRLLYHWRSR